MTDKKCESCAYCCMLPLNRNFVCYHPDTGDVGIYIDFATAVDGHCGPNRPKFEQHPLRTPDGLCMEPEK